MQCQIWQAEVEDDLESKPARDILQEHASTIFSGMPLALLINSMTCKARNQPCFPWGYTHWATVQICANLNRANLTQVEGWCPSMVVVDRCAVGLVEIV